MTHGLRSDLWWTIDQIHPSSEAQCVSHHLPLVDCHNNWALRQSPNLGSDAALYVRTKPRSSVVITKPLALRRSLCACKARWLHYRIMLNKWSKPKIDLLWSFTCYFKLIMRFHIKAKLLLGYKKQDFTRCCDLNCIPFMNSQLVGTNICSDIWNVLSYRPSVLPTKRHPIITYIIQISFPSDKIHLWNLQEFRSSPTSGKPGLFDNSNPGQFRKSVPKNWEWVYSASGYPEFL